MKLFKLNRFNCRPLNDYGSPLLYRSVRYASRASPYVSSKGMEIHDATFSQTGSKQRVWPQCIRKVAMKIAKLLVPVPLVAWKGAIIRGKSSRSLPLLLPPMDWLPSILSQATARQERGKNSEEKLDSGGRTSFLKCSYIFTAHKCVFFVKASLIQNTYHAG